MQNKIQIRTHGVATIFHKDALQFVLGWLRVHEEEHLRVHVGWINSIEQVAACCPLWPKHMTEQDFGSSYFQSPNLAAALLNYLRNDKWSRIESSKAGKLKKFLSQYPSVKWDDSFNSRAAVEEANRIRDILKERDNRPETPSGGRAAVQEDFEFLQLSRTMSANRKHSGPVPDTLGDVPVWDLQDKQIQSAIKKLPWGMGVKVDDIVKARKWVVANQRAGKKFAGRILDKDGFLHVKSRARCRK